MDGIDKYKKQMEDYIEKSIKNGIIDYCKKNKWISYDGNFFKVNDETIKAKIQRSVFTSAIEALDVIKIFLKDNNPYSEEFEEQVF